MKTQSIYWQAFFLLALGISLSIALLGEEKKEDGGKMIVAFGCTSPPSLLITQCNVPAKSV